MFDACWNTWACKGTEWPGSTDTISGCSVCLWMFTFCEETQSFVMLMFTDGSCQRQWRGMQMMKSPNMMVCCFISLSVNPNVHKRPTTCCFFVFLFMMQIRNIFKNIGRILIVLATIPIYDVTMPQLETLKQCLWCYVYYTKAVLSSEALHTHRHTHKHKPKIFSQVISVLTMTLKEISGC